MGNEKSRIRAKKKRIRVTFPNGKTICYSNVTTTMIETLTEIGSNRFPEINLEIGHLPLLSKEIYAKFKEWMKPVCDNWYMNARSDSEDKYIQLRSINDQLDLGLKIELSEDLETEKTPYKEKKSRP